VDFAGLNSRLKRIEYLAEPIPAGKELQDQDTGAKMKYIVNRELRRALKLTLTSDGNQFLDGPRIASWLVSAILSCITTLWQARATGYDLLSVDPPHGVIRDATDPAHIVHSNWRRTLLDTFFDKNNIVITAETALMAQMKPGFAVQSRDGCSSFRGRHTSEHWLRRGLRNERAWNHRTNS
jgi:hypothetical protein